MDNNTRTNTLGALLLGVSLAVAAHAAPLIDIREPN
jgi:hypothetical protein